MSNRLTAKARTVQHVKKEKRARFIRTDTTNPATMDTDRVRVNRYSPAREIACAICNVPYGQVYVAGRDASVHSHEIRLDSTDRTCFIDPKLLNTTRYPWSTFQREQQENEASEIQEALAELDRDEEECAQRIAIEEKAIRRIGRNIQRYHARRSGTALLIGAAA